MQDPIDFQLYGYGGFGYDTSHVPKDDPEPPLVLAASHGHMEQVKAMLNPLLPKQNIERTAKENRDMRRAVNCSKRWTEVDYKGSGFTKEFVWHGHTPLTAAVFNAHDQITEYLLAEAIADPTLKCCPEDNVYFDAYEAVEASQTIFQRRLKTLGAYDLSCLCKDYLYQTPEHVALILLNTQARYKRCKALLDAAKPFWKQAVYSAPHYSKERRKCGYSNLPIDVCALKAAVHDVPALFLECPPHDIADLASRIKKVPSQRR